MNVGQVGGEDVAAAGFDDRHLDVVVGLFDVHRRFDQSDVGEIEPAPGDDEVVVGNEDFLRPAAVVLRDGNGDGRKIAGVGEQLNEDVVAGQLRVGLEDQPGRQLGLVADQVGVGQPRKISVGRIVVAVVLHEGFAGSPAAGVDRDGPAADHDRQVVVGVGAGNR